MHDNIMKRFTYEAGVFSAFYMVIGVIGLFTLIFDSFLSNSLIKDPIESLILILTAIVYFRGFLKLRNQDSSGTAFIFVAAIMGLLLGGLAFLNFVVNGFLNGLFEKLPFYKIIQDYFSLSIVVGCISFIPLKDIQALEGKMVEK